MKRTDTILGVRMLTTQEVASRLNVSRQTVARWVRNKEIPGVRLPSGMIRVSVATVERLVRETGC